MKKVCILIPVYNEEQVLPLLEKRLLAVCNPLPYRFRFLMVNDGSTDQSLSILKHMRKRDPRFCFLSLSRNFGKEAAVLAGMDYFHEDALILMDADLQDPPELIPTLLKEWESGYDDVYAVRASRQGEGCLKRATAHLYYRILKKLSPIPIQQDTGDFRLLDRRCVLALRRLREQGRCTKSLFSWIGYSKKAVPFDRPQRAAGKTKWKYGALCNLAVDGITSLSTFPLRFAAFAGIFLFFLSALLLVLGCLPLAWPGGITPLMLLAGALILFLFGMQFLFLGILGEYVGRVSNETKRRPPYLTDCYNEIKEENEEMDPSAASDNVMPPAAHRSPHRRTMVR